MLENMPRNYISVSTLIEDYKKQAGDQAKNIVHLLECTRHFLAETTPDYQAERAAYMTNEVMQEILDNAAKGFMAFANLPQKDLLAAKDVLVFCKAVMLERLALLQRHKDTLFTYYATHDNALKTALIAKNQL